MSDNSNIEWTEATWSFVTGCTRISEGCLRCYIDRTPPFRMQHRRFDSAEIGGTTGVELHPDRLDWPLKWRKPRRIFVNSLSDIFHEDVPTELIARAFAVMSLRPQHTFQCLTKRHARMRALLNSSAFRLLCEDAQDELLCSDAVPGYVQRQYQSKWWSDFAEPLKNVWLGVSTENQKWADIRIPALLDTPATVRWISAEPLLGPLDLTRYLCAHHWLDRRTDDPSRWVCDCGLDTDMAPDGVRPVRPPALSWVVDGGESGPGARPAHPEWFESIRDQCESAGVSYFHKQNGAYTLVADKPKYGDVWVALDGSTRPWDYDDGHTWTGLAEYRNGDAALVRKVDKKAAGRLLDGRTWDEFPNEPARGLRTRDPEAQTARVPDLAVSHPSAAVSGGVTAADGHRDRSEEAGR